MSSLGLNDVHLPLSPILLHCSTTEETLDVLIPSVFITQHHYRELRFFGVEFRNAFLVKLTPDDMNW